MVNADDDDHDRCSGFLSTARGPIFVPEPLLGEIGYLLGTRCGPDVEAAFIRDTVSGSIEVVSLRRVDRARVAERVEKYGDLPLGTADASVGAVAARFGVGGLEQFLAGLYAARHAHLA
jgi:predicted nucleic acid-binding protein